MLRILLVCTGNVCRSPAAELLLRARFSGGGIAVSSAGTQAAAGQPVDPLTELALTALGLSAAGHCARRLVAEQVAGADLVLGLARSHRAAAVRLHAPAVTRAYTFVEFARLATEAARTVPATRDAPMRMLEETRALRGVVRPRRPAEDDIADPIGAPAAVHRAVVDEIAEQTARIAAAFGVR